MTPDWNGLDALIKEARLAYDAKQETRLSAIVYMIKLMVEDLKNADRSIQSGVVHPSGVEEVQAEIVRENREADRSGDQRRFSTTWISP